jgi:hypothetical protein
MASLDASRTAQDGVRGNGRSSCYAVFVEVAPHKWHALDSMLEMHETPAVGDEIELPDGHGIGMVVGVHGNGGRGTLFCLPMWKP